MNNIKISLGLLVVFGLSACSPKYYSPNTQNVPLISEKGETNLALSYGGNIDIFNAGEVLEFQGAYGITEEIAIKANVGFTMNPVREGEDDGAARGGEIGVGFFKPIKENLIFETYGVFGMGSFESQFPSTKKDYPLTKGDISANVMRIGIQPILGYKSKHFSAAVSSRIVNLLYSKVKGDLIYNDVDQTSYLMNNKSSYLLEPAIILKGGFERLKLQVEFVYSINLSNSDFAQNINYAGIGLSYNLNCLNSRIQTKVKEN